MPQPRPEPPKPDLPKDAKPRAKPPAGTARPIPFPAQKPGPAAQPLAPPAGRARRRLRHSALVWSFLALVALPTALSGSYLAFRAVDQYDTTVGFAVQSSNASTTISILGGISQLTGASDTQAAMVYQFLQSRDLVARLDAKLNLRAMFSRPWNRDPVFAFDPSGSLEDLVDYWNHITSVSYDTGTGLITLDIHAFSAAESQAIAQAAFEAASQMINDLSAIAQEDTMRAARDELWRAEDRLRKARDALQSFRERAQVIDPTADFSGQMGVIDALQSQLAAALVDRDLIARTTRAGDPRLAEADRKIAATRSRIASERAGFGTAKPGDTGTLAALTAEYERLSSDQDFAEKTYATALGAMETAEAAARQQSLYLAAWQTPVSAQTAEYPQRGLLTGLVALFFRFLGWSVLALVYYSLRDRK